MAKIKFYKLTGLQHNRKKINSINTNDDFKERKLIKSKLLKEQGVTRIKANDVVVFEKIEEEEKGLGI